MDDAVMALTDALDLPHPLVQQWIAAGKARREQEQRRVLNFSAHAALLAQQLSEVLPEGVRFEMK
jgi:hypothetical protein